MDPVTLELALEKKCRNSWWLLWIFFLASTPGIFNAMHITSYVFLGGNPAFYCDVQQLTSAKWARDQIINISSPSLENQGCTVYNWNYTHLANIGFEDSILFTKNEKKPGIIKCKNFKYDEIKPKETIVSEWDLVCDNFPLRSAAQAAVAFGKFFGAFFFGLFADRFGRKKIFGLCCLLYIAAGPVGAFVTNYAIFLVLRVFIGVAGSGVYEAGYTILTELTVKNYRAYLGCLYNVSYSLGFIFLPLAAYFTQNWRQLQMAISLPTVLLLVHCWFLPESPRWLITRGKLDKASAIIGSELHANQQSPNHQATSHPCYKKVFMFLKRFLKLFSTSELRKRILICYFSWFVAQLYYYTIALNGTNFTANEYLYIALNGIAEAPGYLLPLFILTYLGRKTTSILLFTVSGIALLTVLIIPQGWPVMAVAMVGRLTVSAVFAVVILHTSELFPTEHRNTAIGSSLTMAQIGTMAAPYVVDILGEKAWYIPSTLCGGLALVCAGLTIFLPETKGKPMLDTIREMNQNENQHK